LLDARHFELFRYPSLATPRHHSKVRHSSSARAAFYIPSSFHSIRRMFCRMLTPSIRRLRAEHISHFIDILIRHHLKRSRVKHTDGEPLLPYACPAHALSPNAVTPARAAAIYVRLISQQQAIVARISIIYISAFVGAWLSKAVSAEALMQKRRASMLMVALW
jgi:hypothetical protein